MPYSPTIYDWRYNCAPIDQVFRAGGQSIESGMTGGGVMVDSPEPGGRGELLMDFAPFATEAANLDASWTVSRLMNGNVMRIRLYQTIQLVDDSLIGGATMSGGIPWANDGPWANGENWAFAPSAPVVGSALSGEVSFVVDLSATGPVLQIGHVIGFSDFAHTVMDISYAGDTATVNVSPPLRRDLAAGDQMLFRPSMLVTCRNASEVMSNFRSGRHMAFSAARFVEALV